MMLYVTCLETNDIKNDTVQNIVPTHDTSRLEYKACLNTDFIVMLDERCLRINNHNICKVVTATLSTGKEIAIKANSIADLRMHTAINQGDKI